MLVLEKERYRYIQAASDLGGIDIEFHDEKSQKAVEKVRNWLVNHAGAIEQGTTRILENWESFQVWYFLRKQDAGAPVAEIKKYPTVEMLRAMRDWNNLRLPD